MREVQFVFYFKTLDQLLIMEQTERQLKIYY
jgi:hypothetical protein